MLHIWLFFKHILSLSLGSHFFIFDTKAFLYSGTITKYPFLTDHTDTQSKQSLFLSLNIFLPCYSPLCLLPYYIIVSLFCLFDNSLTGTTKSLLAINSFSLSLLLLPIYLNLFFLLSLSLSFCVYLFLQTETFSLSLFLSICPSCHS